MAEEPEWPADAPSEEDLRAKVEAIDPNYIPDDCLPFRKLVSLILGPEWSEVEILRRKVAAMLREKRDEDGHNADFV